MFFFVCSLIQVNFINLSKFLFRYISLQIEHYFFSSLFAYKMLILLFMLLMIFCVIFPEKLKYPSIISFVFIMLIILSLCIKCCTLGFENAEKMLPVKTSHWSVLVGNVLYSVEGISSVFTIRSSMQIPTKMSLVA